MKSTPVETEHPSMAENVEVTYLENKKLDGGLLNDFVKSTGQGFKKKMVNGKLQVEYNSEAQTPSLSKQNNVGNGMLNRMGMGRTHEQPISFNNNGMLLNKPNFNNPLDNKMEIRNKLYSNRNRPKNRLNQNDVNTQTESFLKKWQNRGEGLNRNQEQVGGGMNRRVMGVSGHNRGVIGMNGQNQDVIGMNGPNQDVIGMNGPNQNVIGMNGPNQGAFEMNGQNQGILGFNRKQQGLVGVSGQNAGILGMNEHNQGAMGPNGQNQRFMDISGQNPYENAKQYNNLLFGEHDPASNLILKPQYNNNRSHLDSNHTLRSPYAAVRVSRPTSVRSARARTADTMNRRFIHNKYKAMHMYTRYQPSMSKHEHDMMRHSQQSLKGRSLDKQPPGFDGMVYGIPYGKYGTEGMKIDRNPSYMRVNPQKSKDRSVSGDMDKRVFQSIPVLNNIYSFSNLRPTSPIQNTQGSRRYNPTTDESNPLYGARDPGATLRKAYAQYPSNPENPNKRRDMQYSHQNYLYANRPSSMSRSHHEVSISRGMPTMFHARGMNVQLGKVNGRSNILAMFFRKILVFNSKLEGLKQKLFAHNSGFDCLKLFNDFAQENPDHLSMQELMSFFRSLDFNYSPQIVYKILLYLIRKENSSGDPFGTAPPKQFQLTGSGRLMEVLTNRFRSMSTNTQRNPKPHNPDHLDYSKFETFFCPMKETGTVMSDETLERSLHGAKNHENFLNKEAIFHLIRQIVILSLRKLEDLGWVIRSLRLFPPEHLFELLGAEKVSKGGETKQGTNTFNVTSVNQMDQKKNFFPENMKKMKNSLTFQNIPQNEEPVEEEEGSMKSRSKLLNKFLTPSKVHSLEEVRELSLQKFLKANGVDFLTGDLIYIFKEMGSYSDRVGFDQFSGYLTADLWSL